VSFELVELELLELPDLAQAVNKSPDAKRTTPSLLITQNSQPVSKSN